MRAESPLFRLPCKMCGRCGSIASLQAADSLNSGFPALRTGLWNECAFGASENVYTHPGAATGGSRTKNEDADHQTRVRISRHVFEITQTDTLWRSCIHLFGPLISTPWWLTDFLLGLGCFMSCLRSA